MPFEQLRGGFKNPSVASLYLRMPRKLCYAADPCGLMQGRRGCRPGRWFLQPKSASNKRSFPGSCLISALLNLMFDSALLARDFVRGRKIALRLRAGQ